MPHLLLVWCMEHGLSLENVTPSRDCFESHFLCRLITLLHNLTFNPSNMVVAFYWISMVESGMPRSLWLSVHCTRHLSSFYKAEWRVLVTRCILPPPIHNFFFFFVFFAVIIICALVVERTRDVFGALFVKTLDYFHLLFRCNRFAFFSTICFNNYEVRILKTKRRSTGKSFTGETFCGVCLYLFICSDTLCDACLKMGSVRDC
jgi:hypothetical protein